MLDFNRVAFANLFASKKSSIRAQISDSNLVTFLRYLAMFAAQTFVINTNAAIRVTTNGYLID